jgi:hypothetical protein
MELGPVTDGDVEAVGELLATSDAVGLYRPPGTRITEQHADAMSEPHWQLGVHPAARGYRVVAESEIPDSGIHV